MRRLLGATSVNAALVLTAVLTLLPLLWMVALSVMPAGEAASSAPHLLPHAVTWDNYVALFRRLDLGRYALNSLAVATAATVISTLLNSMAGYAFAKLRFRGRDRLFQLLLGALVIPGQVGMLPLFLLLKQMGLINTYWGVVVPSMASIFGIFLVRQFVLGIPDGLLDAARVDGAGEWRIYTSVVLPLSRPILIALAVTTFLGTWNDFLWPLVVLSDQNMYTLPVALANLFGEHLQDTEVMMAGAVVTVLPAMLLFVALQRYYIQGLVGGAVKG
jgi:multiple sugar transport system permease protein